MEWKPVSESHVYQITGYKNTGKTSLLCRLITWFSMRNQTVSTIKHDAHYFELDRQGTDTWKHQQAGAGWTAISSRMQTAVLQRETMELEQLIRLAPSDSLILVEGFKRSAYPKLLMARTEEDLKLLEELQGLDAVVLWPEFDAEAAIKQRMPGMKVLRRDDTEHIAEHILQRTKYLV